MANNNNGFRLEIHTDEVMDAIQRTAENWLEEASGALEKQVKRNSRTDKGSLRGSWTHAVDGSKLEAYVGSPQENAIWEEFGTGEFALEGNGRKTPWYVPVDGYTGRKKPTYNGKVVIVYGKDGKRFYKTNGKQPSRALHNAFELKKPKLIRMAQTKFKGIK